MMIGGLAHVKAMALKFKIIHREYRALRSEFEIFSSISPPRLLVRPPLSPKFFRATMALQVKWHAVDLFLTSFDTC